MPTSHYSTGSPISPSSPRPTAPRERPTAIVLAPPPQNDLIRRLALDRLRELRDDGVTLDYIGRMYDTTAERIRDVEADLRSS